MFQLNYESGDIFRDATQKVSSTLHVIDGMVCNHTHPYIPTPTAFLFFPSYHGCKLHAMASCCSKRRKMCHVKEAPLGSSKLGARRDRQPGGSFRRVFSNLQVLDLRFCGGNTNVGCSRRGNSCKEKGKVPIHCTCFGLQKYDKSPYCSLDRVGSEANMEHPGDAM